jgi:O-antigen/teichoic acid export membrane protein
MQVVNCETKLGRVTTKMKKGVAKPRFVGQLIMGILEIVLIFAFIPYVNEIGGSLITSSTYANMIMWSVLAFVVVHGLWRIIDAYTTMRYAD